MKLQNSKQALDLPRRGGSTGREVLGKRGVFSVRIHYSFSGGAPVGWTHKVNAVRIRSLECNVRAGKFIFGLPTRGMAVQEFVRTGIRRSLREPV